MSSIPELPRGYRDGYRAIIAAMHGKAKTIDYYGATATLDCRANHIGIYGKARFQHLLTGEPDPKPQDQLRCLRLPERPVRVLVLRRDRSDDKLLLMTAAADKHAAWTGLTAKGHFGYLQGLDDAIGSLPKYTEELRGPQAQTPVAAYAEVLEMKLQKLLNANEFSHLN